MIPVYSPSSRDTYSFCPREWWLYKHGYVARTIDYPELCAIGGNAFGKAMEVWNKTLVKGLDISVENLRDIATKHSRAELEIAQKQGRFVSGVKATEFLEFLPTLIWQAVDFVYKQNPLKPYAILAAEEEYPNAKGARCDVRVKDASGRQIIFDYKVKFGEVETKWIDKNFEQYAQGEQRFTYTTMAGVDLFGIIMVILKPTVNKKLQPPRIETRIWPVTDWQKQIWLRDAQLMTPEMDRTLLVTDPRMVRGRSYPHANQYGPCPYEKACMDYGLDGEKMRLDYIQIEKKEVPYVSE